MLICPCSKSIGIWDWASTDDGAEPDVILACAGEIATMESVAAAAILKEHFPDLKVRFVNVVDLFRLMPSSEHQHGTLGPRLQFSIHSRQACHLQLSFLRVAHPQAQLPPQDS